MSSLKSLLLSYNQINPPKEEETNVTVPVETRYDRMLNYISKKKTPTETPAETPGISDGFVGWKFSNNTSSHLPSYTIRARKVSNGDNYNTFITAYNEYLKQNPQYSKYKDLLTSIAGLESSYNPSAKNKGSSALGWFQFLDSTRSDYDTSSREDFANNYNLQFDVASRHIDHLMKQVEPYKNKAKELGLTDLQTIYGMWWRPGSMLNYLETGKDDYINESDGMTLSKILEYAS